MKIGILGLGVVGTAVMQGFQTKTTVVGYDPNIDMYKDTWPEILLCELLFLCLPTPNHENGEQDLTIINETCKKLDDADYDGVVVLKSTVLPGTTNYLAQTYNLRMLHNPEFLTAQFAYVDFMRLENEIISGAKEHRELLAKAYWMINKESIGFDHYEVTELAKYGRNDYLAVKLSFFNEIYETCQKLALNYHDVKHAILAIGNISKTHTQVPGTDGKIGFGGQCLPKDSKAFSTYGKRLDLNFETLDGARLGNKRRRPEAE